MKKKSQLPSVSKKHVFKICCILNNKSGSADTTLPKDIIDHFAKRSIDLEILTPQNGDSLGDLAKQAVDKNYDVVVAAGGDGTINAVASALVGHPSTRLGVIPLGTLNHFARDLGIPLDVSKAIEIICAGYTEAKDVGVVNELYFLNNSSVGLYPAFVTIRESLQSVGYTKWWAALISSFRALSSFRRLDIEIQSTKSQAMKINTPLLFVGNNVYETAGIKMGTRGAIDRGLLWINAPTTQTRAALLFNFLALIFGREKPTNTLKLEVSSLKVVSKKKMLKIATDGEVFHLKSPLNFRSVPKALNVIVPTPQV